MLDNFRGIDITWDKANRNIYKRIRAASSDDNGRKLVVQVLNDGTVTNLEAVNLRLYWKHGEHTGFHDFEPVDSDKGIFQVYFTREMLEHTGKHKVWLHLTDLTGSITSEPFGVEVFPGIDLDALEDTSEFSALNQALMRVVDIEEREQARQDEFEANEADRQAEFDSNETDRQENEDERISNENARKSQESSRVSAESTRQSQETSRQDNEADRIDAESSRTSAEHARTDAESTRKTNETNRENAENTRESNEGTRESNEQTRIENENNRAQSAQELEETYAPRLTEIEQNYIWFGVVETIEE